MSEPMDKGLLASGVNSSFVAILCDTFIFCLMVAGFNNTIGLLHVVFLVGAILLAVRLALLVFAHLAVKVALAIIARAEDKVG